MTEILATPAPAGTDAPALEARHLTKLFRVRRGLRGGKTLTVDLRTGVKFSDGQPFTSADVAYTFNTINSSAAANYSGVPALSSVSTPDSSTVVLNFKAAQYANIFAIAGDTFIVPKHVFSSISNLPTATVAKPVGTGPYVLKSFTTQLVTFTANPHYWGARRRSPPSRSPTTRVTRPRRPRWRPGSSTGPATRSRLCSRCT